MTPVTRNLLLVEDEIYIRDMYYRVLTEKGYLVEVAQDGQEALDKLMRPGIMYDLVILDILLPKVDGISILRKIKAGDSPIKSTPVILLTNLGTESLIAEAISLGAEKYFIKADLLPKDIALEVDKFFSPSD
ncbi:MAG: Response regulator receiver modulated diguanylate cyclase [Candidatus Amesbacteria bacterium GW2011_GWA1_47_16]|uniref:Response regulatory domain-containing protein n=5 Tax=Candidatus Amesiibacteriota TaxID=1752730 RepID=A0A1F4ZUJ9_9BACT|nr:MAG: Response regulator receiver modulated diguanylate cyclase [Candidatus Amesbacteria bacterium GW2011_GWC1_47_15]KKU64176.1 MAG: Response regulator receiver modulated diguanylate cyclase [Candidatus Amesbacteria bacterium GW2011_GWA1_47_16]KKU97339.1 MAG: Response regulator receiver modulated diguanylate cyclase [Candidatus Amesbacteria bacterium GW2011_GWB1_48_13]OGC99042.1 MAG: hypothetical protein A2701_02700 [Candidatus Amesbacteria bacterium RIFCSPHIGHO2_01_FULL_47_34]OGD00540.1 MAG: